MSYESPYARLQTYYALLMHNEDNEIFIRNEESSLGLPISRIHSITGIPLHVIRHDFFCMLKWVQGLLSQESRLLNKNRLPVDAIIHDCMLSCDEESGEYQRLDLIYDLEDLLDQPEPDPLKFSRLEQLLYSGELDGLPFYIQPDYNFDKYRINLTSAEAEALHAYLHSSKAESPDDLQQLRKGFEHSFRVKTNSTTISQYDDLREMLKTISSAIPDHKCLSFKYRSNLGILQICDAVPAILSYDTDENLYCLVALQDGLISVFRLDSVLGKITPGAPAAPEYAETLSYITKIAPNVWGNNFRDEPVFIKVRFYNEANVWQKVRMDLSCRKNGSVYEKDGFLYYEDAVYGISRFKRWLYGYGSSAIVIKPESLRREIIESLLLRKQAYCGDPVPPEAKAGVLSNMRDFPG